MPSKDPRVDAYIEEAAEFARPILKRVRRIVHRGCPRAVETIKWHVPFFEYKGLLCGMPAFKAHCAFVFWRDIDLQLPGGKAARARLRRITSAAELPSDAVLLAAVRAAVAQRDAPRTTRKWRRKKPKS